MTNHKIIAAAVVAALLAGCSANGAASPPASVVGNLGANVLQFAVGTANIGQAGNAIGLNTVSTFRQPNGLTATLVNTPTITAPAGFVPPNCGATCVDNAASHQMSGAPQNVNPAVANPVTTFGQAGGVFSFGIAPENEGATGAAIYTRYVQPFTGSTTASATNPNYTGGPPAYPFFKNGTFPASFSGYSQGFDMFTAAPVAGVYTLSDVVATSNAGTTTFTASSTLANLVPLPALTSPTFVKDGLGEQGGADDQSRREKKRGDS